LQRWRRTRDALLLTWLGWVSPTSLPSLTGSKITSATSKAVVILSLSWFAITATAYDVIYTTELRHDERHADERDRPK